MADVLGTDLLALIEAYEVSIESLRDRVARYAATSWENQYDHSDEAIAGWIAALAPIVEGGQAVTGTLTASYLEQYAAMVGVPTQADVVPPELMSTDALRGAPASELYRRPQYDFWNALRRGEPSAVAVAAGALRLAQIVNTNMQLARTHAARHVLVGHLGTVVIGYRRVIGGLACSLCSGRKDLFSRDELLPIHTNCRCSIVPVVEGGPDPGTLTFGPAGSDRGKSRIVQHDEVGPMLVAADDHFSSA